MSNRRKIKQTRRTTWLVGNSDAVHNYARKWRCPDCHSENTGDIRIDQYGIQHIIVLHDDSCPYYRMATR